MNCQILSVTLLEEARIHFLPAKGKITWQNRFFSLNWEITLSDKFRNQSKEEWTPSGYFLLSHIEDLNVLSELLLD